MKPHDLNPKEPPTGAEPAASGKKPYRAPTLHVYGNVREITKALVQTGNKNDHTGGPAKT